MRLKYMQKKYFNYYQGVAAGHNIVSIRKTYVGNNFYSNNADISENYMYHDKISPYPVVLYI